MALGAIVRREALRFLAQRGRLVSAIVRPLVWLVVFAAGFRAALGLSITPPYQTYITYEVYIVPGLCGMILLFNGMQSSLSLVYDREMGSMRLLLTSPLPRWWLLACKLVAGAAIGVLLQVYAFLAVAAGAFGVAMEPLGYLAAAPALLVAGLMVGALGLALSSTIEQLENFAGVMNFVIFPMFFLSSALYPLWKMAESSPLLRDVRPLRRQPLHPRRRADPLRAPRADRRVRHSAGRSCAPLRAAGHEGLSARDPRRPRPGERRGGVYPKAVACLAKDRDALLAFFDFPAEHSWRWRCGATTPRGAPLARRR